MQQIEIDPVGGEPLEAALAGGDNARARSVVRIYLADDEKLVAKSAGGARDDLLGTSAAIHFGRVDERHAEIDTQPQCRRLCVGTAPVLSHVPGSLPERRHPLAAAQGHVSQLIAHLLSPVVSPRRRNMRRAAPYTRSSRKTNPAGGTSFSVFASSTTASASGASQPARSSALSAAAARPLR